MSSPVDSRLPGFYKLPLAARRAEIVRHLELTMATAVQELATLDSGGLDAPGADKLVENALGVYSLPLGVGLNFRINDHDFLVPMAVEEPSVIAAASNAAKMIRAGGGFRADSDEAVMTAQVELLGIADPAAARAQIEAHAIELLALANDAVPRLVARGGGARGIEARLPRGQNGHDHHGRVVVHIHVDCRDAMGANLVNTVAEALAPRLATLANGRFGLRILTNLCDRRLVRVSGRAPFEALATPTLSGQHVATEIEAASHFAESDPYRAATHNKGIMNGVDAVVMATGNDWRGVEAGAHSYAAISGHYLPLATWRVEGSALVGSMTLPLAVGIVGGTLQVHSGARLALRLLNVSCARALAEICACVGLASNLAALRALATEGIQRGHMNLHNRAVGKTAPKASTP